MSVETAVIHHKAYQQLITKFEPEYGIMWYYMDPKPRPCFTMELLKDIRKCQHFIEQINRTESPNGGDCPIRYGVLASKFPGVYSFGGDLELFLKLIKDKDEAGLREYARACIDVVFPNHTMCLDFPITTLSLVKGDALGGGFESALSSNLIIAEKSARFGLPEVLFNLFPGMGAYNLLARRLGPKKAEQIVLSGNMYSAAELHDMGVVDVLAEDGEGEKVLYEFIARHSRKRNTYQSFHKVRQSFAPITYEELMGVALIWVEAALRLGAKDFRIMERLLKAQGRISNGLSVVGGMRGEGYA